MTTSSPQPKKHIIVLGAGVTGLQTALSFLTHPTPSTSPYTITLLATHFPGSLSPTYTSPWAGGVWRSHASSSPSDAEVRAFDKRTYSYWRDLLTHGDGMEGSGYETQEERVKRIGLGFKEAMNFWGEESEDTEDENGEGLWWVKEGVVEDFESLDLVVGKEKEEVPSGAVFGVRYKTIGINVPRYLEYLFERVKVLGAKIIKADVDTKNGLEGVVRDTKRIVSSESRSQGGEELFALINAAGLSARHFLPGEEARKLFPIRGQTILVEGEAKIARTYTSLASVSPDELLYVIPRPGSGTTIIGGCKQVGNWSEDVDEELSVRILKRVRKEGLADELRTGSGRGFEVLSTQVGFRPARKGGPRVELETAGNGKVKGVWLIHSYGHSGAGYQQSIGSAEKVVSIVEELWIGAQMC